MTDPLLPPLSPYIPVLPSERQWALLCCAYEPELLYGGAAGGAKSWGLLMDQLQWALHPEFRGIIFRRTFPELAQSGGLLETAQAWLGDTDAVGSKTMDGLPLQWEFPTGAKLEFGHMKDEADRFKYRGGAWHRVSFDELATFTLTQYRYIFSRLRRSKESRIPPCMRGGSNPPETAEGAWVQDWFQIPRGIIEKTLMYHGVDADGEPFRRMFLPSKLTDNPHLDADEYRRSLRHLDPVTRARLEQGDWGVRDEGNLFHREWFEIVDAWPAQCVDTVRYWDLAATPKKATNDPDFTVGTRCDRTSDGTYYIGDVQRFRGTPQAVERRVAQTAVVDGPRRRIFLEEEPGSSGKLVTAAWIRKLAGFSVKGDRVTGSKLDRARPFSAQAEAGNVKLVRGPWISDWLDEAEAFPFVAHDDQVDSASGAFGAVALGGVTWESLYGETQPEAEA